jgi:hypothetical protein
MALTRSDYDFILTSLEFTRQAREGYSYDSYEIRCKQLQEVKDVTERVIHARREAVA